MEKFKDTKGVPYFTDYWSMGSVGQTAAVFRQEVVIRRTDNTMAKRNRLFQCLMSNQYGDFASSKQVFGGQSV
jgi:hypothetical protein